MNHVYIPSTIEEENPTLREEKPQLYKLKQVLHFASPATIHYANQSSAWTN